MGPLNSISTQLTNSIQGSQIYGVKSCWTTLFIKLKKKHYLATAEPISEDEFFLEVKENGDVTVIMEVDREDMGDTNNIYTVTFAATEPNDGCTVPPCEALTNVTFRIQVVFLISNQGSYSLPDLSLCYKLVCGIGGVYECKLIISLRRILMTIYQC